MMFFRFWVHIFLILAFVTAGISPACAFISGDKSVIEICAADGSFKRIAVPAALDPLSKPTQKSEKSEQHQRAQEDCAFCFSTSHLKSGASVAGVIVLYPPTRDSVISVASALLSSHGFSLYQSRGPPASLLS